MKKTLIITIITALFLVSFVSADKFNPTFEITNDTGLVSDIIATVLNTSDVYRPEEVVNVKIPTLLTQFIEVSGLKIASKVSFNINFFDTTAWNFTEREYKIQLVDFSRYDTNIFILGGSKIINLTLKSDIKNEVDLNGDGINDIVISYKGLDTDNKATLLIKQTPDLRYMIISYEGVVKKCFDVKSTGNYQCMNDNGEIDRYELTNETFSDIISDTTLTTEQKQAMIEEALMNKLKSEVEKSKLAATKNEIDTKVLPVNYVVESKTWKFIKENALIAGIIIIVGVLLVFGAYKFLFKKNDENVWKSDEFGG